MSTARLQSASIYIWKRKGQPVHKQAFLYTPMNTPQRQLQIRNGRPVQFCAAAAGRQIWSRRGRNPRRPERGTPRWTARIAQQPLLVPPHLLRQRNPAHTPCLQVPAHVHSNKAGPLYTFVRIVTGSFVLSLPVHKCKGEQPSWAKNVDK